MPEAEAIDTTKKPETFLHTVEVEITTEEAAARTKRLLEVLDEIDKIEADKASRVSDFNVELKQKRKEAHKVREAIHLGKERQDVECYEKPDERRNIVFIVRASDHKVLDERAMTLEDRMYLGGEPPTENDGASKPKSGKGKKGTAAATNEASAAAEASTGEGAATETNPPGGKVVRIKPSEAKKRRAEREAKEAAAKARALADENDAANASGDEEDDDGDEEGDDDE